MAVALFGNFFKRVNTPRLGRVQCDQIAILFFDIWPFGAMKICPKIKNICQSRFVILPNTK